MASAPCVCGGAGCAIRVARGLAPFCQMSAPTSKPPVNTFGSYAAAAAHAKILRDVGVDVEIQATHVPGSGAPKRFVVVDRKR